MNLCRYKTYHTTLPKEIMNYLEKQSKEEKRPKNHIVIDAIKLYKYYKDNEKYIECIEDILKKIIKDEVTKQIKEQIPELKKYERNKPT